VQIKKRNRVHWLSGFDPNALDSTSEPMRYSKRLQQANNSAGMKEKEISQEEIVGRTVERQSSVEKPTPREMKEAKKHMSMPWRLSKDTTFYGGEEKEAPEYREDSSADDDGEADDGVDPEEDDLEA
jgi:hypothetical protein